MYLRCFELRTDLGNIYAACVTIFMYQQVLHVCELHCCVTWMYGKTGVVMRSSSACMICNFAWQVCALGASWDACQRHRGCVWRMHAVLPTFRAFWLRYRRWIFFLKAPRSLLGPGHVVTKIRSGRGLGHCAATLLLECCCEEC